MIDDETNQNSSRAHLVTSSVMRYVFVELPTGRRFDVIQTVVASWQSANGSAHASIVQLTAANTNEVIGETGKETHSAGNR